MDEKGKVGVIASLFGICLVVGYVVLQSTSPRSLTRQILDKAEFGSDDTITG